MEFNVENVLRAVYVIVFAYIVYRLHGWRIYIKDSLLNGLTKDVLRLLRSLEYIVISFIVIVLYRMVMEQLGSIGITIQLLLYIISFAFGVYFIRALDLIVITIDKLQEKHD